MFTGIVAALGTISEVAETATGRRLHIQDSVLLADIAIGESVAVNGVCLTVVNSSPGEVAVDVVQESLDRSNLGDVGVGTVVDLERPMLATDRFDGHIVQGHVDGVGVVRSVELEGEARRMRIEVSQDLGRYLVEKGSVTVDGVSLTVTAVSNELPTWFEIVLIPHTLEVTVLGRRTAGDRVNLEMDVLAKYVERLMSK
jgi:riboflavin synthase